MFYSFIVAFFYFDPKLGIGGSEAVGLNNFVDFIGSIILICAGSLGIVYFLVSGAMDSKVSVADVLTDQNIARALRNSLVYSLGSAVLFALMSILLAYPLTTRSKVYPVVLFQVLVANGLIAEWQVYRALGIHDSVPYLAWTKSPPFPVEENSYSFCGSVQSNITSPPGGKVSFEGFTSMGRKLVPNSITSVIPSSLVCSITNNPLSWGTLANETLPVLQ